MRRNSRWVIAACAVLLCGGCNPVTVGIAASPLLVKTKHTNLLNGSYAAVDVLVSKTQARFSREKKLLITPLKEIERVDGGKLRSNPNLGLIMTDHIIARFHQLGYNVAENTSGADGIITGAYEIIGKDLAVRLRFHNARTGELYEMYDYWMPVTSDIRRYMGEDERVIPVYKIREDLERVIEP
ncbi:MAG: hypothetical protein WC989_07295 [Micavibrio sp.]